MRSFGKSYWYNTNFLHAIIVKAVLVVLQIFIASSFRDFFKYYITSFLIFGCSRNDLVSVFSQHDVLYTLVCCKYYYSNISHCILLYTFYTLYNILSTTSQILDIITNYGHVIYYVSIITLQIIVLVLKYTIIVLFLKDNFSSRFAEIWSTKVYECSHWGCALWL